jgi:hypothetical protein
MRKYEIELVSNNGHHGHRFRRLVQGIGGGAYQSALRSP